MFRKVFSSSILHSLIPFLTKIKPAKFQSLGWKKSGRPQRSKKIVKWKNAMKWFIKKNQDKWSNNIYFLVEPIPCDIRNTFWVISIVPIAFYTLPLALWSIFWESPKYGSKRSFFKNYYLETGKAKGYYTCTSCSRGFTFNLIKTIRQKSQLFFRHSGTAIRANLIWNW